MPMSSWMRPLLCLTLCLAAAPLWASVVVHDGYNRSVTIHQPPTRIVSLFASNTELLAALGLEPQIVGIEDYTHYPPGIRDNRTIVGGRLGFSAEAIARLRPDLVILTPARGAADSLIRPMSLTGTPVLILMHKDVEQIFTNLDLLGTAAGVAPRAQATISELRRRLARVQESNQDRQPLRVYLELGDNDRGALQTVREGTYTADALRLAGAQNVFAGLNGITQVSGEAVIRANPEVILVARTDTDVSRIANRPGWANIDAVRNGRVYVVDRAQLLIPGPRVVDGVEQIARLLYAQP